MKKLLARLQQGAKLQLGRTLSLLLASLLLLIYWIFNFFENWLVRTVAENHWKLLFQKSETIKGSLNLVFYFDNWLIYGCDNWNWWFL